MLVPALLSAGFALTANAFLLPPELANNYEANYLTLNLKNFQSRDITIDCSNCPFALASQRNGLHEWTHSVKSDLELKFSAENDQLKLNGVPFYPVVSPLTPAPLSVKQTKKPEEVDVATHQGYDGDLSLSYSIEVHDVKGSTGPEQGVRASEITFSILGLDNEVARVDDIKIRTISLLNPANGQSEVSSLKFSHLASWFDIVSKLLIVSVDAEATGTNSPDAQCATILCRAMFKFRSAVHKVKDHAKTAAYKVKCICIKCINAMKHAHHRHSPHHPATPDQDGQTVRLPTHNRFRPGHFKPHNYGHGHGHHHSWVHVLMRGTRQIVSFVLFPIVVGIIFGVATSAIGMLVGQLIVLIWLRLRRKSSNKVAYKRLESEEKEGLPAYKDLEDNQTVTDEKA
ncbi:MAG: hypothetical protein Q9207_001710 [Kuettlingeria erythrocarpa]